MSATRGLSIAGNAVCFYEWAGSQAPPGSRSARGRRCPTGGTRRGRSKWLAHQVKSQAQTHERSPGPRDGPPGGRVPGRGPARRPSLPDHRGNTAPAPRKRGGEPAPSFRWLLCLLVGLLYPATPSRAADRPEPDLRLVVWYDRARPLETFRYQVYDLRRHEFTPKVGAWVARVRASYPRYEVDTRDVVLARERGDTEKLRIGSAVIREFLVLGTAHGYDFGGMTSGGAVPPGVPTRPVRPLPRRPSHSTSPASPTGPFPIPYPRPHL